MCGVFGKFVYTAVIILKKIYCGLVYIAKSEELGS